MLQLSEEYKDLKGIQVTIAGGRDGRRRRGGHNGASESSVESEVASGRLQRWGFESDSVTDSKTI